MPISLTQLTHSVNPQKTVLFFGAGSSIPSGAPSVSDIIEHLSARFSQDSKGYSLSELSGVIENKTRDRKKLISCLRELFKKCKPTGGLLNLPLYDWKSIFTTNYDHLIENAFDAAGKEISIRTSNSDFTGDELPNTVKLFKLHGTIGKDISDGFQSRIILTESDYDQTDDYREFLYDRLRADLAGAHLIIIGYSLADTHIKELIQRAATLNAKAGGTGKVSLLLYIRDEDRAALFEARGINVCFASIDDFFSELAKQVPLSKRDAEITGSALDRVANLRPITVDVGHAIAAIPADVTSMYNGWPASYADIASGLTFSRAIVETVTNAFHNEARQFGVILGASGLGKTTAARQVLNQLQGMGYSCWEHKSDYALQPEWWLKAAKELSSSGKQGALLLDDAHNHLREFNDLVDLLAAEKIVSLKILCTSAKNHWGPRVKSPHIYRYGVEWPIQRLQGGEIDSLLNLLDHNVQIQALIDSSFGGFSRQERRRRLVDRCESETFVCLKNIFANEKFDDIILREYAALDAGLQEIYRYVSAMENAGIHVHRQLVIRLLGIAADNVKLVLGKLEDIVEEYTIDEKEGIYGWRGRHPVIVGIVAKYKFSEEDKRVKLFERVIESISPTYEIEIRSIRELCNIESGLASIPNKVIQNRLLRRLMSVAPGERVPRHRLVRNLIEMQEYEKAETEIRIFEKDFRSDGPIVRYRINLMVGRAVHAPGIMLEDRKAILEQARAYVASVMDRYKNNKNVISAFCDLGIEYFKLTGDHTAFEDAVAEFKAAEVRLGDPDISRLIRTYERRMSHQEGQQH